MDIVRIYISFALMYIGPLAEELDAVWCVFLHNR